MVETTREVGPQLISLGSTLADLIPVINNIGKWVINEGVPAFNKFASVINGLWKTTKPVWMALGKAIGGIIQTFQNMPPWLKKALFIGGLAVGAALSSGLLGVVAAITAATLIWNEFKGFVVNDAIPALQDAIEWVTNLKDAFLDGLAIGMANALTTVIVILNNLHNAFAKVFNAIVGLVEGAIQGVVDTLASGLNGIISTINSAISTIPWDMVPGMDAPDQLSQIEAPTVDLGGFERGMRTTDRQVVQERVVERIGRITVENGEIVAKMDERANEQLTQQQRRIRRNTGVSR